MSDRTGNSQRNVTYEGNDSNSDFDFFITSELPIEQIHNMLRVQKKSDDEIEKIIEKIRESREAIKKVVRKFVVKMESSYGHLDVPELIKKGMKYANKYGLNEAQKKVFIAQALKGDIHGQYTYDNELRYSEMSKFFGFDAMNTGQMIRLQPKDQTKLNELHMLYNSSKHIHSDIKNQTHNYRDCAPEALVGQYNNDKHNVSVSIHPVVAALFFPKVGYLERKMLHTNIARMVLQRAQAYIKTTSFFEYENVAPGELEGELDLAQDIAYDPNSLAHFPNDNPLDNIIKRFRVQIELWKNVLNLRQGKYYSNGYDENDGISGLLKILNSYEWSFFDSPDLFHVQDEGTVLRKLLAVFSCRPTFTQLSSFVSRSSVGQTAITNLSKTTFVNIPIVNIKLPINIQGTLSASPSIRLQNALYQTDNFIEHKMVVPKTKTVIFSKDVAFFYANRRYPTVNFNKFNMSMRYVSLPTTFVNTTTINDTNLLFTNLLRIGKDWFDLRSVVVLQRPTINCPEVATGCSAMIVVPGNNNAPTYLLYSPQEASAKYLDTTTNQYVSNRPITDIYEASSNPDVYSFKTEAQKRGTIFFYVRHGAATGCVTDPCF